MMRSFIIISLVLLHCQLLAQDPCGHDSAMNWIYNQGPVSSESNLPLIPRNEDQSSYSSQELCATNWRYYTLPVVFHIVHPTADFQHGMGSNVPDSIIERAVAWVNDAFRNRGYYSGNPSNSNPFVQSVDTRIQFARIQRDEQDKNAIFYANSGTGAAGICRWPKNEVSRIRFGQKSHDSLINYIKSQIQWIGAVNPMKTIQIIVVDSIQSPHHGYAFPENVNHRPNRNVVVIEDEVLQNRDQIKYLVHQLGHLLLLQHTFGDDCSSGSGDFIKDTPTALKPTFPFQTGRNTCSDSVDPSPFSADQPDLYENYMDISPVKYQNTFTKMQSDNMNSFLKYWGDSLKLNKRWVLPFKRYASIDAFQSTAIDGYTCQDISTQVKVVNFGDVFIDSVRIIRLQNAVVLDTIDLNVSLNSGKSDWFELPVIQIDSGNHVIEIVGHNVSSTKPINWESDRLCQTFRLFPSEADTFVGFDKPQLMYHYSQAKKSPWKVSGYKGPGLKFCRPHWQDTNLYHHLVSNPIDLSNYNSAYFEFEHSFLYPDEDEDLEITLEFSSDCFQSSLMTVEIPYKDLTYNTPRICNQILRKVRVNLTPITGNSHVQLRMSLSSGNSANSTIHWPSSIYFDNFKWVYGTCPFESDLEENFFTCTDSVLVVNPSGTVIQWSNCDSADQSTFSTGTHWVERMSSPGCFSKDTFSVKRFPKQPYHTITRNGDTLFSSIDSITTGSFKWYLNDTLLTVTTLHYLTITQNGKYSLHFEDSNGCLSSSGWISVNHLSVSTHSKQFSIQPNPSQGKLLVTLNQPHQSIRLTDLSGKDITVNQHVIGLGKVQLDWVAANGIYLLSITFKDGTTVYQKVSLNKL